MCRNPYIAGEAAYGCGQCMPCRINRRRVWAHRIMLEASLYADNAFVTLTYDDANVPKDQSGRLVLDPGHLRDFLKRVRKDVAPGKIRYYAVGEYGHDGEREWNPHYHLAMFNMPGCRNLAVNSARNNYMCRCDICDWISRKWGKGRIHVGYLASESASYICGYVTKKMTSDDDYRLDGRPPEFARMSLKPGIGADMMCDVASQVLRFDLEVDGDVPTSLRHGRDIRPLGRYLSRRLRKECGREEAAPAPVYEKMGGELRDVRSRAEIIEKGGVKAALLANDSVRVAKQEFHHKFRRRSCREKE